MRVFIYGTLLDSVLRERLLGRDVRTTRAVLHDHVVLKQASAPLPAIVQRAGAKTNGLLLSDLTKDDIARLDAYEIPFDYNPVTQNIDVDGAQVIAQVYVPAASVAIGDRLWTLSEWDDHSGALTREMANEIGAYDPPLTGASLLQQWHMIALRAGVRLRSQQDATPASRRFTPKKGDVDIVSRLPLLGGFFKLCGFDVNHRTFQNKTAGPLRREVLVACDAAIVLPYDPKTDCVLLVEQLRMGPLIRGVSNPWLLEPVAGMIDGVETPVQAARRETEEEAGLTEFSLEEMFSFYPSPGASTDYFYCYLANGTLPAPTTYTGGLAEEHEDLRIHVLPYDDAMALIETGEANVGPLIAMLFWLSRNRDRLRAAA